jgi:OOP family OmpA-OmpF porin
VAEPARAGRSSVLTPAPDADPPAPVPAASSTPPSATPPTPPPTVTPREVAHPGAWSELRTLIVGPERDRLDRVEHKLENPQLNVDEVSRVLPEAVLRRARDRELGNALGPVVGEAIKASVRKDPQPIVDAIFPVIGPAIRRAISAAFAELVESVNTTLEHSFSPRGLGWRLEALRTGKSFGEVVLSHSLVFRAEQLFVIHRESGLLLAHLTAPGVKALSPEMVAGMLTAITDFARDSFQVSRQEGLDSLAMGDLTVWIEQGPAVTLASVVRGHAPAAYREVMQEAVEGVQRAHASDLERFSTDGAAFEVRPELIEPCLVSQLAEKKGKASPWKLILVGALVLAGIGWCAAPRISERRAFDKYIAQLRQEPGVVVGNVGRSNGEYVVTGLRDPLARDPIALLAAFGLDTVAVRGHWEPYVALRPEFVLRRVGAALQPPSAVQLSIRADTIAATGVAPERWLESARITAAAVSGVSAVDFSAVRDSVDVALRAAADSLEEPRIAFARGEAYPTLASVRITDTIAVRLASLIEVAARVGRSVAVAAIASTDSVGDASVNSELREARAATLRSLLIARGVPRASVTVGTDSTPGARQAYLRVSVQRDSARVP